MLREQVFVDKPSGPRPPDWGMDRLTEPTPVRPENRERDTRVADSISFGLTAPKLIIEPPGVLQRAAEATKDHLAHRLNPKTIAAEVSDAIFNRIIPHGATELAHALFLGHAFAPYGYTLTPLEPIKDGDDVHGSKHKEFELEKG